MKTITACLVVVATAASAAAQDRAAAGNRSLADAWAGCWAPIELQAPARTVRVCVVPGTEDGGLRLLTFADDQQVREEHLVADGTKRSITEGECQGDRTVRRSASGFRLFVTSELRCQGGPSQPSSIISTLTSGIHWVDVQVTGPAGRESVRIRRYERATDAPPAAVAALLGRGARTPPVVPRTTLDDVVEAAQAAAPLAVEAWLAETEPRLTLDRRALRRLADAGASEPTIDLLVGLAYPSRFSVRRYSGGGGGFAGLAMPPFLDAFGPWDYWSDPYGFAYSPMGPFLYDTRWYGPYNGAFGPIWPYGGGIYTQNGGGGAGAVGASGRGQVVNGRGYTRVESVQAPGSAVSSGGAEGGRQGGSVSASDGGSVSPGGYSSGVSSAGGGGGGGGGGGATAVPR